LVAFFCVRIPFFNLGMLVSAHIFFAKPFASCRKLELEQIQTQMAQKPTLRPLRGDAGKNLTGGGRKLIPQGLVL
jgi:hypothetical protein